MEDFLNALKDNLAYDFISNEGWHMDKDDLINILKEYIYYVGESSEKEEMEVAIYNELKEQLN